MADHEDLDWSEEQIYEFARVFSRSSKAGAWPHVARHVREALIRSTVFEILLGAGPEPIFVKDIAILTERLAFELATRWGFKLDKDHDDEI